AILNELGDVVGDAAMYLPLALRPGFPVAAIVVFALLGVIVEMTGVIGVQVGASRRYDGFGKSDRAFVVGAIGLVYGLGWGPADALPYVFWIAASLSAAAIAARARRALTEVRAKESAA
ncbi:MAG TPA: CDP-alcohol phosphatidyltransferase family protein, partial [Dokdonella sp.]|nr:CDP-alcohol phosphatidyltransferase family protein [Dokdonella sp.]